MLEEVVVVGYGSLSKKEVSSSIVQVDKKNFNLGAMNNPMEMVSGKVAGLNVNTQAAANPNSVLHYKYVVQHLFLQVIVL